MENISNEEILDLANKSISSKSLLPENFFKYCSANNMYLALVLWNSIDKNYINLVEEIIDRLIKNFNLLTEDFGELGFMDNEMERVLFESLYKAMKFKLINNDNKILLNLIKIVLNYVKVKDLRETYVQALIYILTSEQRHEVIGYDLYESKNCKEDLELNNKGLLNSKLISTPSYKDYYNGDIFDLNIVNNYGYTTTLLHEHSYKEDEMPVLMYMYLREFNNEVDEILRYEFYRYLDSFKDKDYVLTFLLNSSYNIIEVLGRYYFYLYQNGKIDLDHIKDIIETEYNVQVIENGGVEYDISSLPHAILLILYYNLNLKGMLVRM